MQTNELHVVAFDCFGTVFDMTGMPKSEMSNYVWHVRGYKFTPFVFPRCWYELKAHPDSREGIRRLREAGFKCVTLSNGSYELISSLSKSAGIEWDKIIDLVEHKAYKPNLDAYHAVEKETGACPFRSLMVTANPTFGDLEGAAAIGMRSQVIRHGALQTIIDLADMLIKERQQT